jgi:large subunit ribosomal protein L35
VTGAGKILRRQAMKSHYLSKKSAKRKRKFRTDQPLDEANVRTVKRLLGGKR